MCPKASLLTRACGDSCLQDSTGTLAGQGPSHVHHICRGGSEPDIQEEQDKYVLNEFIYMEYTRSTEVAREGSD